MKYTLEPTEFSAVALYEEGRQVIQDQHKDAEKSKIHTLRGGSAGILLPDGSVIGQSPWAVLARYLGYQLPIQPKSLDIFDGGFKNEIMWEKYLKARGTSFTGEENYPLKYVVNSSSDYELPTKLHNKADCTGRPDLIILRKGTTVPVMGVELKGVMSVGTAADVFYGDKPKDDNFIQACHYAYKFNLPWILAYTSESIFKTDFWNKKKYGVDQVDPFRKEFKIGCEEGKFYYITEAGVKVDTYVTTEGIDNYYLAILESAKQKDISWMRFASHDIYGNPINFDLNLYDKLCCLVNPNTSFDIWLEGVKQATSQTKYIQAKKIGKDQKFRVEENGEVLETFNNLTEARAYIFGGKS